MRKPRYLQFKNLYTAEVAKQIHVTGKSEREIERIERGMLINIGDDWCVYHRAGRRRRGDGMSAPIAYLRDAGGRAHDGEWDECWVPCAKGDPGAVEFSAGTAELLREVVEATDRMLAMWGKGKEPSPRLQAAMDAAREAVPEIAEQQAPRGESVE